MPRPLLTWSNLFGAQDAPGVDSPRDRETADCAGESIDEQTVYGRT